MTVRSVPPAVVAVLPARSLTAKPDAGASPMTTVPSVMALTVIAHEVLVAHVMSVTVPSVTAVTVIVQSAAEQATEALEAQASYREIKPAIMFQ